MRQGIHRGANASRSDGFVSDLAEVCSAVVGKRKAAMKAPSRGDESRAAMMAPAEMHAAEAMPTEMAAAKMSASEMAAAVTTPMAAAAVTSASAASSAKGRTRQHGRQN
jgi:hypothetical protein